MERSVANKLDLMTKDEIFYAIKKSGCPMLRGLQLKHLKKDVLIEFLEKKKCPELERLIHASQKQKE